MSSRPYVVHRVSTTEPTGQQVGDEWFNPVTNTLTKTLAVNGTAVAARQILADVTGNISVNGLGVNSLAVTGTSSVQAILERATITASAPTATTNFDVSTQAIQYYTTNASLNFTFNIRGNSTTALNTLMQVGQSCTIALFVTNGVTPFYPNVIQVDGVGVTPLWQGGTAPTAGNASSVDVYTFTVIKTNNATYAVFAVQSQFK